MARSKARSAEHKLIRPFADPDVPKRLSGNKRFKKVLPVLNPSFMLPTVKTMNAKLWERFNQKIEHINGEAAGSEFITITFDGWSSVRK